VDFDNKAAKILDSADNLITATVPAFDYTSVTPVVVTASNHTMANELLPAEKKLNFTYYPTSEESSVQVQEQPLTDDSKT